jgi:O-antigen biosynthesis protein
LEERHAALERLRRLALEDEELSRQLAGSQDSSKVVGGSPPSRTATEIALGLPRRAWRSFKDEARPLYRVYKQAEHVVSPRIDMGLDQPAALDVVAGKLDVVGWVTPGTVPLAKVEVRLGDTFIGTVPFWLERPDLLRSRPWLPRTEWGFRQVFLLDSFLFRPGLHRLTVRAIDGAGKARELSRPVVLTSRATSSDRPRLAREAARLTKQLSQQSWSSIKKKAHPLFKAFKRVQRSVSPRIEVALDVPRAREKVGTQLQLVGWVSPASAPIQEVSVRLGTTVLGRAEIGVARPDVQASRPWLASPNCGFRSSFSIDASAFSSGKHRLVVEATDTTGAKRAITRTIVVSHEPSDNFDLLSDVKAHQENFVFIEPENQHWSYRPLISLVVPVFDPPEEVLREMLESVLAQSYLDWELCVVDGGSKSPWVAPVLQEYAARDPRVRVRLQKKNLGISGNSNAALAMAQGEFVGMLDHDDVLETSALHEVVRQLNVDSETDVIYTDQDKIDSAGRRVEPFHKPAWSPELFRGVMYVGHLLVIRRSIAVEVGGFDPHFDGVQDFEFMLRVSEKTTRISHIPKILYHWRMLPGSVADDVASKPQVPALQVKAVNAHLKRSGVHATARQHPKLPHRVVIDPQPRAEAPLVSIVIPSKDAPEYIGRCLNSIYAKTTYSNFEVVVVDNGTTDPRARRILEKHPVRIVPYPERFNFSRANNLGVAQARGDHIVLLNNDTEVVTRDWLEVLIFHLGLPGVAAVGPLLLYPNRTVQHAGVVLGLGGTADHVMRGFPASADGYAGSLACTREVSAVTGACVAMSKATYLEAGGFVEHYGTHYQDTDLCLRLRAGGSRILYTPRAVLIHHESVSRGKSYDHVDRALFLDVWRNTLARGDPYYNPNFSLERWDYALSASMAQR